ncbi:MAG: DMT family transporter [Candidatus Marsarchaeota archaeon]|nr:DMT family transporter [Candidatus Marsarchaeota archaeon]
MVNLGLVIGLAGMLSFTFADSMGKGIESKIGWQRTVMILLTFGIIPAIALFIIFPNVNMSAYFIAIAMSAGIFFSLGYVFMYRSLNLELSSLSWALLPVEYMAVIVFAAVFLRETLNYVDLFGIFAIFLGVLFVTLTKRHKFDKKLMYALVGTICWAIAAILFVYAVNYDMSSFAEVFLIVRIFAIIGGLAYFVFTKDIKSVFGVGKTKLSSVAAVVGVFDSFGQASVLGFVMLSFVALGNAILAFEPILVAIISYFIYNDRLTMIQKFGIAISVIGAITISVFA